MSEFLKVSLVGTGTASYLRCKAIVAVTTHHKEPESKCVVFVEGASDAAAGTEFTLQNSATKVMNALLEAKNSSLFTIEVAP